MASFLSRLLGRRNAKSACLKNQDSTNDSNTDTKSDLKPESLASPSKEAPSPSPAGPNSKHGNNTQSSTENNPEAKTGTEEEPYITLQDRLDKKRKEKGLRPIPRVPDRSDQVEPDEILLHSGLTRFVVLRPDNVCVKFGSLLNLDEVDAIQFAKDAGIPVPEVLKYGKEEGGRSRYYIEMKYIEGDTLQAVWSTLSDETRLEIAHQLRDMIKIMYSIPPPTDYIGAYNSDRLFDPRDMDTFIRPACRDQEEFHAFLTADKYMPGPVGQAFRKRIGNSHKIVFAHGDIAPRNIIVRDNRIVALIDWEGAGWYPAYWEYVKFTRIRSRCPGWENLIDEILPESYGDELLLYSGISVYQAQFDNDAYESKKGRNQEFLVPQAAADGC